MDINQIKSQCFRYFDGKSDYNEEKAIYSFLSEDDHNKTYFREWEEEWYDVKSHSFRNAQSFENLKKKIKTRRRNRIIMYTSIAAASVAALAVIGLSIKGAFFPSSVETITASTKYMERSKVVLPDSSTVWLNSATTLTYDSKYDKKNRNVTLSGEAFFDVRKNDDIPFVVRTGNSSITVKGTKFNVTAYSNEKETTASLLQGRIDFSNPSISVSLVPDESITYDMTTGNVTKQKTDVSKTVRWLDDKLDYEDITMSRLLLRLTALYGIDIQYIPANSEEKEFSILLNASQSVYDILDAVSCIVPINYRTEGATIIVTEKE